MTGVAAVLVLVGGCSGSTDPVPTVLADGSPARASPVTFEDVSGPTIETRAIRRPRETLAAGSRGSACFASSGQPPRGPVVERVGASGSSVTLLGPAGRAAYACDAADGGLWCGHAFGRLEDGRLRDPRLSLTCRNAETEPVGFAWVQPGLSAAYVVVAHDGYSEAYPVAGGEIVRISTSDVDAAKSRGTFAISEHARDGRRIRAYELRAQVAA